MVEMSKMEDEGAMLRGKVEAESRGFGIGISGSIPDPRSGV